MTETLFKLRCSLAQCKSMKVITPSAGYTAGQMTKVGDTVGVIVETKTIGQEAVLVYSAPKIVVAKRVGTSYVFAVGSKVYYRSGGPDVSSDPTSNVLCGRANEIALGTDDSVEITLNGDVVA